MNQLMRVVRRHPYVCLVLVVSVVFRFAFSVSHVSFTQDIARDAFIANQALSSQTFLSDYGPKASVGDFYLPPFYYQIHLIFSFLTNGYPLVMKWFVTGLEALTPVLLYMLFKRLVTDKAALTGSLLYVFAVTPTLFGTNAWNPNTIPFFATLALFCWLKALVDKKFEFSIVSIVATSIAFQLHFQATLLFPFSLMAIMYLLMTKQWRGVKYVVLGVCLSLVLLIPYLWAEYSHTFLNTHQIIQFFSEEHAQYFNRVSKPEYLLTFFPRFFEFVLFDREPYRSVVGLIVYFGGGLYLVKNLMQKKTKSYLWICLYLLCIVVMLRVYKGDKVVYYMSSLFFWPFLLISVLLDRVKDRWNIAVMVVFAFLIGFSYGTKPAYNQYEELKNAITYLEDISPSPTVRFLFHDDDHVNTVAYGVTYLSSLMANKSSDIVVDICGSLQRCAWDGVAACSHDLPYSVLAEYKTDAGYEFISEYGDTKPFKIVVGRVNQPELSLDSARYLNYDGAYGSDLLFEALE